MTDVFTIVNTYCSDFHQLATSALLASGHKPNEIRKYKRCAQRLYLETELSSVTAPNTPRDRNARPFDRAFCSNISLTMTYFHTGTRTIIGAEAFHCPVRDGKEWDRLAMVIRLDWLIRC